MQLILLNHGQFAQVDDDDYEELNQYKWNEAKGYSTYYAIRCGDNGVDISMQQQILNPNKGQKIDHKDGNGLNNQRFNIRICTHQQNQMNLASRRLNHSSIFFRYIAKIRLGD